MFTIGNIICIGLYVVLSLIFIIGISFMDGQLNAMALVTSLLTVLILGLIIFGFVGWYNTHTASGKRALKDTKSELNDGINREITITSEDGRQIFYYKGKVDIESNHEDNYIKFESEDGRRFIVYYGIQDTIVIEECME